MLCFIAYDFSFTTSYSQFKLVQEVVEQRTRNHLHDTYKKRTKNKNKLRVTRGKRN